MFGKAELNYIKNKIKNTFPYLKEVGVLKVSGRIDTGEVTLRISISCASIIFKGSSIITFSVTVNPNDLMLAANYVVHETAKEIATNISIIG